MALALARYNLGVAWLYGFGGLPRNPDTAVAWFHASGLPEGMMAVAMHKGLGKEADVWKERAHSRGFGSPARLQKRDQGMWALHQDWSTHTERAPPTW